MPRMYLMFKLAKILHRPASTHKTSMATLNTDGTKVVPMNCTDSTNYILADKTERNLVVVDKSSQDKINSNCQCSE